MTKFLWPVLIICAAALISLAAEPVKRAVPAGFVTTNGKEFELDGKPFVRQITLSLYHSFTFRYLIDEYQNFVGANSYVRSSDCTRIRRSSLRPFLVATFITYLRGC